MKVVFAGPTIGGMEVGSFPSLQFRLPARSGDIVRAVRDGATMIGLIDGVFERKPSVWHKEILFALSEGIPVLGAASMGALRAAECHVFGMIGIGEVFEAYASGLIEDDEDVAQLHGPPELSHLPLSEPLVNIRATLGWLLSEGLLTQPEHDALAEASQALFFKDRSYRRIVECGDLAASRKVEIAILLKSHAINIKQRDASRLLAMMEVDEPRISIDPSRLDWTIARTRSLETLLQD